MITVGLVQSSTSFESAEYLPYTVGVLQAYAQSHLKHPEDFRWLMPVYKRIPLAEAEAQLAEAAIVGFSLYVWNEQYSLELARRFSISHPKSLIVFGGPQVPDHPEEFLRANPYIDVVVHGEGERAFTSILEFPTERKKLPFKEDLLGSISLISEGKFEQTPKYPRIADLSVVPSPYTTGVFEDLMAKHHEQWIALWETNRGCPYSCFFVTGARLQRPR